MAIGVLCALFAGVFRYVDQHFYTPETFLENNAELADNADVREFLLQGFRDEIIELADGDGEPDEDTPSIAESLAAEEAGIPDPVTQARIERDEAIELIVTNALDSDAYDRAFTQALTQSQTEFVRSAELESRALLRDKGEIFFNMQALYQDLWPALAADEKTASITAAGQQPPQDYGIFKVADRDTTINPVWTLLQNGPGWRGLTMLGAVLSFIGAVAIADRRPSTAIQFGTGMVGVGVVAVVIIFLIRFMVPLLAGSGSASQVVATYVSNTNPLVGTLIRLAILGAIIAVVGAIARFIWPDNWVYSSVSDERGVRSIRRRPGDPEPVQQQPVAAAVPLGYPGYPQQPYGGYPPQAWGQQPYPGQFPPGYVAPYPVGPYGQPIHQQPNHYTSPGGQPTIPVERVQSGQAPHELVPPPSPPYDAVPGNLPADAAQVVPRVVATTDTTLDAAKAATQGSDEVIDVAEVDADTSESVLEETKDALDDDWVDEKDW